MSEDFLKILVIIVIISFLIYYVMITLKKYGMIEGLENMKDNSGTSKDDSTNIPIMPIGGAADANKYDKQLKNVVAKMNDALLIKKYRKDYENIIIDMDDLVNVLMLKTVLNTPLKDDPETIMKQLTILNELNSSKTALNNVMKYIDKN